MTIPSTRFTASGGDLSTPVIGFRNIKNSKPLNATTTKSGGLVPTSGGGAAPSATTSSWDGAVAVSGVGGDAVPVSGLGTPTGAIPYGSGGYGAPGTPGGPPLPSRHGIDPAALTPAAVVGTFEDQTDLPQPESTWYADVRRELLTATTVSTIDDLATNTIINASSIGTINNLMHQLFTGLKLPPTLKAGYNALTDIDRVKVLQSVVESSPDGFSRAIANFPFYDGADFMRDVAMSPEYSQADRDQVYEDLIAGITSFSYSKGQSRGIQVLQSLPLSPKSKDSVLEVVVSNAIKTGNIPAIADCFIGCPPEQVFSVGAALAPKLTAFDRNPDTQDRADVVLVANALGRSNPDPEGLLAIGVLLREDFGELADGRPSTAAASTRVEPLTVSGWNTALMGFAAEQYRHRGGAPTSEFQPAHEYARARSGDNIYIDDFVLGVAEPL